MWPIEWGSGRWPCWSRRSALLTDDYSCYDTLHAVLPTRLPRETFYQSFANLYRQQDIGPYYELVQAGKMTVEDCRRGKTMLEGLTTWEQYVENDSILGEHRWHKTTLAAPLPAP